ncbi:MAG: GDP-mannose 4,6-dehydratase, partial [Acidobacteriota bacterium]
IVTRCTNNYGPWQHPEKFVPLLISRALQGGELPIYGDGLHVRDWIHVEDHCAALVSILKAGIPGRIYTIAGGNTMQNVHLASSILSLAGARGAFLSHVEDRPGHDRRYALDDSATRAELRWEPKVPLEKGLAETVQWYRQNRLWWERITEMNPARRHLGARTA